MLHLVLERTLNWATDNKRTYPQKLTSALEERWREAEKEVPLAGDAQAENLNFRYSLLTMEQPSSVFSRSQLTTPYHFSICIQSLIVKSTFTDLLSDLSRCYPGLCISVSPAVHLLSTSFP